MVLTLDLHRIQELGLNLNQYLILLQAWYKEVGITLEYTNDLDTLQQLQEDQYIKITPQGPVLRDRGWKVFEESPNDKFKKFLELYPKTVPAIAGTQRGTAPEPDSWQAGELRRIWAIITQYDENLQNEIIRKLEYDLEEKERTGNLMYLPHIKNWLEKRTWENIHIENRSTSFERSL